MNCNAKRQRVVIENLFSQGAAQKPNCLELEDGSLSGGRCLLGENSLHGLLSLLLDFLLDAFDTLADESAGAGGESSGLNGGDHFELFVVLIRAMLFC
jgi:hypothetical protein